MTPEEDDDAAIAAEYVLGLLTPAEAAAFEARMAVDTPFRALVARWAEDFARLADAVPEEAPPRALEGRVMRELFPDAERGGIAAWLRRLGVLPALLGGLVAALLVLGAVNLGLLRDAPVDGAYAARIAAADGSLVWQARFDPAAGRLLVAREAGTATPGRSQELWIIVGDAAPVSLGLLPDADEAAVAIPEALAAGLPRAVLAVTDEPPGGSPTGNPSGPPIALGPITTL